MSRVLKMVAVIFATVLGFAACTGRGNDAPRPQQLTHVAVDNQAWLDVDVYAVAGSQRTRLGTVTAHGKNTLRIPLAMVGAGRELQFLVDPVGSRAQGTSWNIFVTPGQQVRLTIPPQFGR
ncbi:MAG TPA: hypothetical protein VEX86_10730 [Longimicrobium sp.]|nr:hypothetical protein [Longimicrobium sp.]